MTTRNKSALGAVRMVSMAGISAAALLIGMAAAHAQSVNATGASTNDGVSTDGTGNLISTVSTNPITGLVFNDGTSNTVTIDATAVPTTVAATFGNAGQTVIGPLGDIGTTATITGGSLSDGVATLTGGSLTGAVNGTFSGTVTGGTLTDGFATLTGGNLSGVGTIGASGLITGTGGLSLSREARRRTRWP